MSRAERLLLLAFFAGLLALLGWTEPSATAFGAVAGAVTALAGARRLDRLRTRMDSRLGIVEGTPRGVRPTLLAVRVGLHLLVLGTLLLTTAFVPFDGDEVFAAAAAGATSFATVLTAWRLR